MKPKTLKHYLSIVLCLWLSQMVYAQTHITNSTIKIVGSSYLDTGMGNMTLDLPEEIQQGDVTLLFMGQSDANSLKFPSGWQEITDWGRPGDYNDVNLKTAFLVYKGGSRQFSIGTHKKSLVYAITLRGVDNDDPIIEKWTINDTNNKYLNGDRGGCVRGSDGRAMAKSELASADKGLHFVAAMYDDPQRDVKIYNSTSYNTRVMEVLRSWHYGDDGLTVGVESTQGQRTAYRYFKGDVCRGGNAEGVVASFTLRPGSVDNPTNDWIIDNCENINNWKSHNSLSASSESKEGTKALQSSGSLTDEFYRTFTNKDFTGATSLEFWYYVSSLDGLTDNNQVELGSGGKNDLDEYSWSIDKSKLTIGWNAIKLNLSEARVLGNPDLSRLNWFRLYRKKDQSVITRIDHLRMTKEDPNKSVVIDYCDTLGDWMSHNRLVLSGTYKEGTNSIKSVGDKTDEFYRTFDEKDLTGTGTLEFWYYVSTLEGLLDINQVELGSGGKNDQDEYNWKLDKRNLQVGWNAIRLKISDATTLGNPDLSRINWFRLYRKKEKSVTTRIDFIRMTNVQSEEDARMSNPEEVTQASAHILFPNPSNGKELRFDILIQESNDVPLITIRNSSGMVVYSKKIKDLGAGEHHVRLTDIDLGPAVYFAEIKVRDTRQVIRFLVTE